MLCAAMHEVCEGDIYIGDWLHYELSVEKKLLVAEPFHLHKKFGEWWWRNSVPEGVTIDPFYEVISPEE